MAWPPLPPEKDKDSGAGGQESIATPHTPMERFRALGRRLARVSPDEIKKQQEIYEANRQRDPKKSD